MAKKEHSQVYLGWGIYFVYSKRMRKGYLKSDLRKPFCLLEIFLKWNIQIELGKKL